ncbi:MAG: hypothetical protein J6B75_03745 [Ruminococcus sp.]|nr:hypothetical protein [Ruminococcus sp.]
MKNYDDIIELPRPRSEYPRMSRHDRAAQFSPFAALTGYEDEVEETARITDSRIEADEDRAARINDSLRYISENIYNLPKAEIIYFVPDERKSGGKYIKVIGEIRLLEEYGSAVIFKDGRKVPIKDIYEINLIKRKDTDV